MNALHTYITNECITYLLSNATVSYFNLAIKIAAFGGFPSYYLPFFFSERPPAEKKKTCSQVIKTARHICISTLSQAR